MAAHQSHYPRSLRMMMIFYMNPLESILFDILVTSIFNNNHRTGFTRPPASSLYAHSRPRSTNPPMKCLRSSNAGRNLGLTSIRSLRIAISSPPMMGIREAEENSSAGLGSLTSQISKTGSLSVENDFLGSRLSLGAGAAVEGWQHSFFGIWFS